MLAAVQTGTLPQWVTVFTIVAIGIPILRGARGTAVTNLRSENHELEQENKRLTADNLRLKATRDLEPVMAQIVGEIKRHENASAKRDEAVLHILDLIATRLGPDNGNGP